MGTNVEGFFNGLYERMWKENDLSDVTYALCVGNVEFRQFFLNFFFRNKNLCATEVDISREWCDGEGNRPDFCIRNCDGRYYFVEIKLWDGNLHFQSYCSGLKTLNDDREGVENLAYIAAYEIVKESVPGCHSIHTWSDFYNELKRLSFINDSVIKGYCTYVYAVAGLHNERQSELDIKEYPFFNANDFLEVRAFMKSLDGAIANARNVTAYNKSPRWFIRGFRMGRFFEVKNYKDKMSVWGWIGAFYNSSNHKDTGPEICVWFEDRQGWGKLVCDKFRDKYSGGEPVNDIWFYKFEGGHLYFYMLNSDKDVSAFFNRVLEKIRSGDAISCKLENDKVKAKYKSLLSMRRFPLWIDRNFLKDMQVNGCAVMLDASGDSEDPYNHCGRYFTVEKRDAQPKCCGNGQQINGWVGVLFGESEGAVANPRIEVQFQQGSGRDECVKRLGKRSLDMASIASEFRCAMVEYCNKYFTSEE